jgi:hypothetical protein
MKKYYSHWMPLSSSKSKKELEKCLIKMQPISTLRLQEEVEVNVEEDRSGLKWLKIFSAASDDDTEVR